MLVHDTFCAASHPPPGRTRPIAVYPQRNFIGNYGASVNTQEKKRKKLTHIIILLRAVHIQLIIEAIQSRNWVPHGGRNFPILASFFRGKKKKLGSVDLSNIKEKLLKPAF